MIKLHGWSGDYLDAFEKSYDDYNRWWEAEYIRDYNILPVYYLDDYSYMFRIGEIYLEMITDEY